MKKHPTTTLAKNNKISPWLSASGELAYTPENPPARDYFFQYGWILPEVTRNCANRKSHYYFGHPIKADSDFLFDFWNRARNGRVSQIKVCYGHKDGVDFTAPIAIYRYRPRFEQSDHYLLIQHGSYQLVKVKDQPFISEGLLTMYRGIRESREYKYLKIETPLPAKKRALLDSYFAVQVKAFSDSALSFAIAHSRVIRCETDFLNLDFCIWDRVAESVGFEWKKAKFAEQLSNSHWQSFTLDQRIAAIKFGPNYVKCTTPVSNIRLTTFFAGEHEVMAIDPRKVEIIATMKCHGHFNSLAKMKE